MYPATLRILLAIALSLPFGAARAQSVIVSQTPVVTLTASADPLAVGDAVTLSAAVAVREGGGVPGGTLQFIDETSLQVLGWADVARPTLTLRNLPSGVHHIRADYSGTLEALPLLVEPGRSAPLKLTVRGAPQLALSSSQNPSAPGQVVTLTVTVSGASRLPTGTVTLSDGDIVLAAHLVLDRCGSAAFTTSALADGARVITATYEGDADYSVVATELDQRVESMPLREAAIVPGL